MTSGSKSAGQDTYWQSAAADEAMQDEHGFIWHAMLDTIDVDLRGRRVLDAGCNQGGFLRLLVDDLGIREGYGYDPASGAIDDARQLAGDRPLHFEMAASVPAGWGGFGAAFSHEVLYLLEDLPAHAAAIFAALEAGASYYPVMGVHADSPLMSAWHAEHAAEMRLPRLYHLDDVVGAFEAAGFTAAVAQLRFRFIPVSAHRSGGGHRQDLFDWVDYYTRDKILFRFTHPGRADRPG
jgi:hypothetical protein